MWSKISFHTLFPASFFILILITVSLTLGVYSYTSQRTFVDHADEIMQQSSDFIYQQTKEHLVTASDAVQLLRQLAEHQVLDSLDFQELNESFYSLMNINSQISAIFYATPDGQFIMSSRYNDQDPRGHFTKIIRNTGSAKYIYYDSNQRLQQEKNEVPDTYDPRKRPWYQQSVGSSDEIWTDPYLFFTSQSPGITTARAVYTNTGELQGVIGVDLTLQNLSEFVGQTAKQSDSSLFIIDENRRFLAISGGITDTIEPPGDRLSSIVDYRNTAVETALLRYGSTQSQQRLSDNAASAQRIQRLRFSHGQSNYYGVFRNMSADGWSWTIGMFMDEDQILGTLIENRRMILILGGVIGIIFSMLGYLLSRGITAPLREIQDALNIIAAGSYPTKIRSNFISREFSDITIHLKQMSDNLRSYHTSMEDLVDQKTRELQQALEARTAILAAVSHEMRTPLNALMGYSELLKNSLSAPSARSKLDIMSGEAGKLLHLINQILDQEKMETRGLELNEEAISLQEMSRELIQSFQVHDHSLRPRIFLVMDSSIPSFVYSDRFRLYQVLSNLLSNAVKYCERGDIHMSITRAEDGLFRFSVRDRGIGIPESKHDEIFDAYNRGDETVARRFTGTGLGLSISRRIVERMGGRLEVTSKEGDGSEFFFTIPLKEARSAEQHRKDDHVFPARETPRSFLKGRRVLLGEDYPVTRELISYYLSDSGCNLDSMGGGNEILATAANKPYDIILLDLHLPEVDGIELAEKLRKLEARQNSCFIAISADVELVEQLNDGSGPFDSALLKPFTREELISIIDRSCRHSDARKAPAFNDSSNGHNTPIEMGKVVDTLDGDSHQAFILLEGFLAESEKSLQQLQELMAQENWKESHRLVHSLRSGAQLLFAGSLAQQAGEIEEILKSRMDLHGTGKEDSSDGYELFSMLQTLFQAFEEVQNYCEQHILNEEL